MDGSNIHILEELSKSGGSLDGTELPMKGYVMRGGREMENHFECLWDLFRSIPSLEIEDASVLDEFYWLNKEDPNYSRCRVIEERSTITYRWRLYFNKTSHERNTPIMYDERRRFK